MELDMKYGKRVTEEFQRKLLAELLATCTPAQKNVFNLMYRDAGPTAEKLPWALTQVHNSVMGNEAGAVNGDAKAK